MNFPTLVFIFEGLLHVTLGRKPGGRGGLIHPPDLQKPELKKFRIRNNPQNWQVLEKKHFDDAQNLDEGYFNCYDDMDPPNSPPKSMSPANFYGCNPPRQVNRANVPTQNVDLWPTGGREKLPIPLAIHASYSDLELTVIAKAVMEFKKRTNGCISFTKFDGNLNFEDNSYAKFMYIYPGKHCSSPTGRQRDVSYHDISLNRTDGPGQRCLCVEAVEHELMHALGFEHEFVRFDRDNYVTINEQYISKDDLYNFDIGAGHTKQEREDLLCYDYRSVMNYPGDAFSNTTLPNGQKALTIVANVTRYQNIMGKVPTFSRLDVMKLRCLYQCLPHFQFPNDPRCPRDVSRKECDNYL